MKFHQQLEEIVEIHDDSLKNEISESSVITTLDNLSKYTARDICDFAFLHVLILFILFEDFEGAVVAKGHCTRTVSRPSFKEFTLSNTDLYVYFHIIFGGTRNRLKKNPANDILWKRIVLSQHVIRDMLIDLKIGRRNKAKEFKFLYNLEKDLKIENPNYRSCRRLISSWNDLTTHDQNLVIDRIVAALRSRCPRSDLLHHLEDFKQRKDLANQKEKI